MLYTTPPPSVHLTWMRTGELHLGSTLRTRVSTVLMAPPRPTLMSVFKTIDSAVFTLLDGPRPSIWAAWDGCRGPSARQAAAPFVRFAAALRMTRRHPRDAVLPWL